VASWKAEFTPEARRQFERLDRSVQRRIQTYLNENVLAGDPRHFGRALRGDLSGLWRNCDATRLCNIVCALDDIGLRIGKRAKRLI